MAAIVKQKFILNADGPTIYNFNGISIRLKHLRNSLCYPTTESRDKYAHVCVWQGSVEADLVFTKDEESMEKSLMFIPDYKSADRTFFDDYYFYFTNIKLHPTESRLVTMEFTILPAPAVEAEKSY